MKTTSIFLTLLFLTVFAFFTQCTSKKEATATESNNMETKSESVESNTPQFEVDASFQQQLAQVFNSYVSLKDAFFSSDVNKISSDASTTTQLLNKVDMKLISGAAHNDWMTYLSSMQSALKEIESQTDIEAQRIAFSTLSDNLYKSIKAFGLGGKEAFYEFCPMAFNNEGGYWLSDKEQIQNPYFGEKMPTCGSVVEKLE
jgi:hypothetical protein